MSTPRFIRLSPDDNVVVAVDQFPAGSQIAGQTARERVPRGHKMAVRPVAVNEPVRKYGQIIGFASQAIAPGEWVHVHNVAMHDFARDYRFAEDAKNDEVLPPDSSRFWPADGYEPGHGQPSFDKQPLRDWLDVERRAGRWNGEAPPPTLPTEVVQATSLRYLDAYRRLTGTELEVATA